jgi:hypothetical protein
MEIRLVRAPHPNRVAQTRILWRRGGRLLPACYQAADFFEQIPGMAEKTIQDALLRLASLSSVVGPSSIDLLDPAKILFGPGAGWINFAFLRPRPGRFSTTRWGAFYLADGLETAIAEVRHHLQARLAREGIGAPLDLDYRALRVQVQGEFHDLRTRPAGREPWASLLDPDSYSASQAFSLRAREAGCTGLVYPSVRRLEGCCAAVFDPNALRACRHDTYLTFRWNGKQVGQVYEKRILPLR